MWEQYSIFFIFVCDTWFTIFRMTLKLRLASRLPQFQSLLLVQLTGLASLLVSLYKVA